MFSPENSARDASRLTARPCINCARALGIVAVLCLTATPHATISADIIEIPAIISLTGPSAFLGKAIQQGLDGVAEVTNRTGGIAGRQVKFVYYDDQTNPQVAVQLMKAVAQDQPLVLGSENVATCQAMASIAKDGPVIYCLSPGVHPNDGSYAFSAGVSTHDVCAAALRYFASQGVRRVATIMTIDASGQDADRAVDEALATMHGELTIVDREHFNASDFSVSAQMAKIKAANPAIAHRLDDRNAGGHRLPRVPRFGDDDPRPHLSWQRRRGDHAAMGTVLAAEPIFRSRSERRTASRERRCDQGRRRRLLRTDGTDVDRTRYHEQSGLGPGNACG